MRECETILARGQGRTHKHRLQGRLPPLRSHLAKGSLQKWGDASSRSNFRAHYHRKYRLGPKTMKHNMQERCNQVKLYLVVHLWGIFCSHLVHRNTLLYILMLKRAQKTQTVKKITTTLLHSGCSKTDTIRMHGFGLHRHESYRQHLQMRDFCL